MKKFLLMTGMVCLAVFASGQTKGFKTESRALNLLEKLSNAQEALNVSEKLDSTISETWNAGTSLWIVSEKRKHAYQTVGSITTVTSQKRDASTSFLWLNYSRTETTVNGSGNTTLLILSSWNNTSSQWIPTSKSEFTYDANGNETLFTFSSSSSGTAVPVWVAFSKTESVYTGGLITLETDYKWVTLPSPGWEKTFKTEYTYSGANLIKDEDYIWDKTIATPDWVKSDKNEYTYSGANLIKEESSDWDKTLGVYVKSTKYELSYTSGKMTQETSYEWDLTLSTPDWVFTEKSVYTYTGNNITMEIVSSWDKTLTVPAWVNSGKTEISYDVSGGMTMYSWYNWDGSANDWDGFMKSEFTSGTTNGKNYSTTTSYGGDPASAGFIKSTRSTSWYSGLNTAVINRSTDNQVTVYPNPASENITFSGISGSATVVLTDMRGNKVMEQTLTDEGILPVGNLSKGLYIYKVTSNGLTRTGRVILK